MGAATLVKIEALTVVASPATGILERIDRGSLRSSTVAFMPPDFRIMLLRRIVPLWDGLEK